MSVTNDRGPTIIRGSQGWTAVSERFAAGGSSVEEALANYWQMVKAADPLSEPEPERASAAA